MKKYGFQLKKKLLILRVFDSSLFVRFAAFVDGQDHLSFSEVTTFEVEQSQMTDDESDY